MLKLYSVGENKQRSQAGQSLAGLWNPNVFGYGLQRSAKVVVRGLVKFVSVS